jgi:class 3 adenylate cyclase
MAGRPRSTPASSPVRVELEPYSVEISLASIPIGIDNVHYDVSLSQRFEDTCRKYILDLVKQAANMSRFYGSDTKMVRPPEISAFKKVLSELLQAGLTRAKYEKNIEVDILLRLAVLKLLTNDIAGQFSTALLEGKEWIRARGEFFERSEKAHVLKAQLSELQSDRRRVFRQVGQQVFQILSDLEDNVLAKSRRALFGEDFAPLYDMLRNRLIFVEGGRDDQLFMEHYVMLGNFQRDFDRFENIESLFLDFLSSCVSAGEQGDELNSAWRTHEDLSQQALELRAEVIRIEERREQLVQALAQGEGLISRMLNRTDPAMLRAELTDLERRHGFLLQKLDGIAQQLDAAKSRAEFQQSDYYGKLGDFLNAPENARRLFDVNSAGSGASESSGFRAQLLDSFIDRLQQQELLFHVLASYELRNIYLDYCPPLHLQQLKRALVMREEMKVIEDVLKQFPARQFSMQKISELAKTIRKYSREQVRTVAIRFAEDFMRLRRDLRNAQKLTALMERINLIRIERTRELSRMNNSLNEFRLPDETRPAEDRVISHAVIKADVRGSTQITRDLLSRGLNPASHFSLNFYEPVKRILDQYGAFKVFVEGDAIILAIYESESNRASQRAVAKACLLAREMLAVAQNYNQRARTTNLPKLELGLGIAFQNSPPTYWVDGESKIMISRALNMSDRLSSCSKVARRMLAEHNSPFNVYLFQTMMEEAGEEEIQELLVRYNMNGIELNADGFAKLSEEISLTEAELECEHPWGKEKAHFFFGEVPFGERIEQLTIRKGTVRQMLAGGKIGERGTYSYYEVCTGLRFAEMMQAQAAAQGALATRS